jgi:hypothetical protein
VTGVTLRVESVIGDNGAQGDLFDRGFASAPAVEDAIVQLTDDQGDVVVEPVNTAHPLLEERTTWRTRGSYPERSGRHPERSEGSPRMAGDPSVAPLPQDDSVAHASLYLQLIPTPKVVTVDTAPRRDHDVPTRYLDGNEWHDIIEAAGPDRVAGGEWSVPYSREYFRCVREDGMMVWLFRGAKQQTSDWFLHGWWD